MASKPKFEHCHSVCCRSVFLVSVYVSALGVTVKWRRLECDGVGSGDDDGWRVCEGWRRVSMIDVDTTVISYSAPMLLL